MKDLEKKQEAKLEEVSTAFEGKLTQVGDTVMQSTLSSVELKIKHLEDQTNDYKLAREEAAEAKKLASNRVDEKKLNGRLDELSDYYRHLNRVVESMIEKFTLLEKVSNKVLKSSTLPPIRQDSTPAPTSPQMLPTAIMSTSTKNSLDQQALFQVTPKRNSEFSLKKTRGNTPPRRYGNFVQQSTSPPFPSPNGSMMLEGANPEEALLSGRDLAKARIKKSSISIPGGVNPLQLSNRP